MNTANNFNLRKFKQIFFESSFVYLSSNGGGFLKMFLVRTQASKE